MSDTSFEQKKAFHAKQSAYAEMADIRQKMNDLHAELADKYADCEQLQEQYDQAKADGDRDWTVYNQAMLNIKAKIGEKITSVEECNKLAENLRLMAEADDEEAAKAEIYSEGAKFFSRLAAQKLVERDDLIAKKRTIERPDNSRVSRLLTSLKQKRSEHAEILEKYHNAKNEYSLKRQIFDQEKAKYDRLCGRDVDEKSARPTRLSYDERLLLNSGIPERYWHDSTCEKRADGRIDIYYGEGLGARHGHVVMLDNEVEYSRAPQKIS